MTSSFCRHSSSRHRRRGSLMSCNFFLAPMSCGLIWSSVSWQKFSKLSPYKTKLCWRLARAAGTPGLQIATATLQGHCLAQLRMSSYYANRGTQRDMQEDSMSPTAAPGWSRVITAASIRQPPKKVTWPLSLLLSHPTGPRYCSLCAIHQDTCLEQ